MRAAVLPGEPQSLRSQLEQHSGCDINALTMNSAGALSPRVKLALIHLVRRALGFSSARRSFVTRRRGTDEGLTYDPSRRCLRPHTGPLASLRSARSTSTKRPPL